MNILILVFFTLFSLPVVSKSILDVDQYLSCDLVCDNDEQGSELSYQELKPETHRNTLVSHLMGYFFQEYEILSEFCDSKYLNLRNNRAPPTINA